jgi:hypothetical protein
VYASVLLCLHHRGPSYSVYGDRKFLKACQSSVEPAKAPGTQK